MKTAVIGGGLGGLVTALLLAERGAEVTVFERAHVVGGRARTTDEGGFRFNFGPHAIYRTGPAERLLTRLGVKPAGAPAKAKGFVLFEDRLHTLPSGPLSLLTTGFLDAAGTWEAARLLAGGGSFTADFAMTCELDRSGKIRAFHTVLATPKLAAKGARVTG